MPAPGADWASDHMPLLHQAAEDVGSQLAGLRIAICLHIEPKTAVLGRLLVAAGATVALTGSPGTTRPETVDWLVAHGVHVHAARDDTAPRVDAVLDLDPHLRGGTEETTTGAILLREREQPPDFPIVSINDSRLKLMVENRFGVGQSVVQGFMNATNLMLPGTRATVVGYGPCGRGVAQTMRQLGALVTVVDTDPYRALEAVMEGCSVASLADALPTSRFLFLATGRPGVLGAEEVKLLPDGVVVAGVSHHPWELDLGLLGPTEPDATPGYHRVHRQADGRRVTMLAENRMINLVAGLGNPVEAMDLGLTLQLRSLAAVASGDLPPGVQPVPDDVDRAVAEAFLAARTSGARPSPGGR
jgi:adenosylhomocysteinase